MTTSTEIPAGVKKITFDFDFEYSAGGEVDLANTIILRAPGIQNLEIDNKMTSHVFKAFRNISSNRDPQNEDAEEKTPLTADQKKQAQIELEKMAMTYMAMGLSTKEYNEVVLYAKKILTNNSVLACIVDANGKETEYGISDLLWQELEQKNGLKPFRKIVGTFFGFFTAALSEATEEAA